MTQAFSVSPDDLVQELLYRVYCRLDRKTQQLLDKGSAGAEFDKELQTYYVYAGFPELEDARRAISKRVALEAVVQEVFGPGSELSICFLTPGARDSKNRKLYLAASENPFMPRLLLSSQEAQDYQFKGIERFK